MRSLADNQGPLWMRAEVLVFYTLYCLCRGCNISYLKVMLQVCKGRALQGSGTQEAQQLWAFAFAVTAPLPDLLSVPADCTYCFALPLLAE